MRSISYKKKKKIFLFPYHIINTELLGSFLASWEKVCVILRPWNLSFLSRSVEDEDFILKIKCVLASNYAWNDPVTKGVEP